MSSKPRSNVSFFSKAEKISFLMDTEFNLWVNPPIKPLEFKEKKNLKLIILIKTVKVLNPVSLWLEGILVLVADRVNIMQGSFRGSHMV